MRVRMKPGAAEGPTFVHNTLLDVRASFDSKQGDPATTNADVRDNILTGLSEWKTSNGSGCSGCSFSFNLFDDAGSATGSKNQIGAPVFTGGNNPSTWAGWALAAGSPGENAADDGMDMGAIKPGP